MRKDEDENLVDHRVLSTHRWGHRPLHQHSAPLGNTSCGRPTPRRAPSSLPHNPFCLRWLQNISTLIFLFHFQIFSSFYFFFFFYLKYGGGDKKKMKSAKIQETFQKGVGSVLLSVLPLFLPKHSVFLQLMFGENGSPWRLVCLGGRHPKNTGQDSGVSLVTMGRKCRPTSSSHHFLSRFLPSFTLFAPHTTDTVAFRSFSV